MGATLVVDGSATAYRLYDVGYGIQLDHAAELAGADTRGRARPERAEAQTFEIRSPPLNVLLGERDVVVNGTTHRATVAAHLFDFGVCALRLTVDAPRGIGWEEFTSFGNAFDTPDLARIFDQEITTLLARVGLAIERPRIAPVTEEYVVFRVDRLDAGGDGRPAADLLTDERLVPLLLSEQRSLSSSARRELLSHRFSYYGDDLAVVTWDNALVVEPQSRDLDVEFVVEFANAQLLELRVYDAELDAQLPTLYDRIAAARRARLRPIRRFSTVISSLQLTIADITEIVERADNAFKVTDDVYLARIYGGALEVFREHAWRSGIDRKLGILRDTYTMLNAEAQATRAELLELAIVILIIVELVLALGRG